MKKIIFLFIYFCIFTPIALIKKVLFFFSTEKKTNWQKKK